MHVLMLGGTGFIGTHVVRVLHESGHRITVFHRASTARYREQIGGRNRKTGKHGG